MLDNKLCLTSVVEFLHRGCVDRGTGGGKVVVVVDSSKRKVIGGHPELPPSKTIMSWSMLEIEKVTWSDDGTTLQRICCCFWSFFISQRYQQLQTEGERLTVKWATAAH